MKLHARLRKLEQHHATDCPVCGGEGKHVVSHILEGETPPEVEGCEHCGKANRLLIVFCNESLPGQPTVPNSKLTAAEMAALYD